jgi:hypothetical protein
VSLMTDPLDPGRRRAILRRAIIGLAPYLVATILAAVSSYVTLAICTAIAAYYATPLASVSAESASAG